MYYNYLSQGDIKDPFFFHVFLIEEVRIYSYMNIPDMPQQRSSAYAKTKNYNSDQFYETSNI